MNEKRYFEKKDRLKLGLDFIMEQVLKAHADAQGEPEQFNSQVNILIAIYQVLNEDIDNENLTDIDNRIEEFKIKATGFISRINLYCQNNEISKKQIN
ncbi:MAG: hypothetical protein WC794_03010 [Candidatus Doudnabacteria bacterium]|jgi:hypothetical protein